MNENRISENDMFKTETIEKLIDTKDIIKSHLDSLDAKHMIKSLLAFLVVYKEVFTETNQPIKNYIQMVSQNTQKGGNIKIKTNNPTNQPTDQKFNQLANQPTNQKFNQLANQKFSQPASQPAQPSQPASKPARNSAKPASQKFNQPPNQPDSEQGVDGASVNSASADDASVNEQNISLISNVLYSMESSKKDNSTSILDDINYLPVLKQIAVAFVDVIKKLISTSLDIAKNMSQNVSDNIGKTSKNVFSRTAIKYAIIVIITVLILSEEQIKNTPTNQIAAVVKQKVKSYSEHLNMLTNDPNHVEAIRELSLVVASAVNKAIDLIEPQVSEIIQKLEKLLENASHDIARGVTHTSVGLVKAFIAEAPIVGGLVDFAITGAEAFTSSAKIAKSLVKDGGSIVDNVIQILSQFSQLSDEKKGEISNALNNFNKLPRISSIPSNANLVQPNNPQEPMGGGKKMSNKSIIKKYNKIQKNIIKTSKRISETLKKFKNNKKNKTRRNK